MTPSHNGGFTTFILSTDDNAAYEPDKRLLSAVCNRDGCRTDHRHHPPGLHAPRGRRARGRPTAAGRRRSTSCRPSRAMCPSRSGTSYLGVPVASQPGSFELTPEMLTYYGTPIDGQAETALKKADGVIPDEQQMYLWIKAAFRHFFNNVQKDPQVQIDGLRACRLLLAYLLREIGIQRERVLSGQPVDDTMLTRLLLFQLGRSAPTVARPANLDPRLVSDLRIAENVMGTIVGAIAGQEEATCRVIDSLVQTEGQRVSDQRFRTVALRKLRRGDRTGRQRPERHARREKAGASCTSTSWRLFACSRKARSCFASASSDGARIADSRPISGGHARLRRARLGDERHSRAGRLHPRPASRALPAVRLEPAHLPRSARLAGHHRRDR